MLAHYSGTIFHRKLWSIASVRKSFGYFRPVICLIPCRTPKTFLKERTDTFIKAKTLPEGHQRIRVIKGPCDKFYRM